MNKTISLADYGPLNKDFRFDPTAYYFVFSIVDSSLVDNPRQRSAATNHAVTVTITWEVLLNWGNRYPGSFEYPRADEPDLVKLLFWYAKECIEENVKSGRLSDKEELEITTQTAEAN
jgi:hypothetical protein